MNVNVNTEKIIARVRALYRLAENNPSEKEAQSALSRARKILQEYNLTEVSLFDNFEENCRLGGFSEVTEEKSFREKWKKLLALVIQRYYDVGSYFRTTRQGRRTIGLKVVFYGIKANVRVAAIAYASILRQIEDLARVYSGVGRIAKAEYRIGLIDGFDLHLTKIKSEEPVSCTVLAIRATDVADAWLADSNEKPKTIKFNAGRYRNTNNIHYLNGIFDSKRLTTTPLLEKENEKGE